MIVTEWIYFVPGILRAVPYFIDKKFGSQE